ncbi:MAG: PAS domain-containing protein [Polyangiaceae bacterium]
MPSRIPSRDRGPESESEGPDQDFRRFASVSHDLFCTASGDGYFTWVSDRFTEVLGHSAEVLLTTPFIEFVHPDDVDATLAEVATLAQGVPTVQFSNRYRCADGSWRWFEWSTTPIEETLYCTVRDVTERKLTERDAERELRLLEMSLQVGGVGYWVVDLVNETVHWSPEIYVIHGLDPEKHTPTLAAGIDAYHPDDRQKVQDHITAAIEKRSTFDFELRLCRPDGEVRLVHSRGRPQVDDDGRVVGIFGIFRDLTDDERVRRQEELEQFAFVASHDLKEPLRTITTYLDLLAEELDVSGDLADYWGYVHGSAARMSRLVNDLLRFARAGSAIDPTVVDLDRVLNAVVQDLGATITHEGATVEVEALPRVMGDETRLRQVFQNLVANALKFRSEAAPHVRIEARRAGPDWAIHIRDNGVGFDPEMAERIFQPFQRLQTDKPGTGIGLAVARRIVRECRGTIRAESDGANGATFILSLRSATDPE